MIIRRNRLNNARAMACQTHWWPNSLAGLVSLTFTASSIVRLRPLALALALATAVGISGAARAAVLFDNIDPTAVAGSDAVLANGPLADSITIGGSGSIQQISLMLTNPALSGSVFSVSIVGDDGEPAPLGSTIWSQSFSASLIGGTPTILSLFPSLAGLAPGTRYWVELSSGSGANAQFAWDTNASLSGPGVAGEFNYNAYNDDSSQIGTGVAANPNNHPYQLCVSGTINGCGGTQTTPSAPVVTLPIVPPSPPVQLPGLVSSVDAPEPAGVAAFGLSLLGLFMVRRKYRRA